MVNVSDLVKQQRANDRAERRSRVTTWQERTFLLVVSTPKALGVDTGRTEMVQNPRTGWEEEKAVLAWLPRSQVRLIEPPPEYGEAECGTSIVLEAPDWLLKRNGLE